MVRVVPGYMMMVKLEEALFKAAVVALNPCARDVSQDSTAVMSILVAMLTIHGALYIRVVVMHDTSDDVVIVVASGLFKVIARGVLEAN